MGQESQAAGVAAGTRTSHRWNEVPGSFDAVNARLIFPTSNQWGIPDLPASSYEPARLVAYNDRYACEHAPAGSAVHFFLDDYRFETCWTKPLRPLTRIARVGAALTPDFSVWTDMPPVMQMWQVYRSRWYGAWLTHHAIDVVPTVTWAGPSSYGFAFAGLTPGGVVAVSSVGTRRGRQARNLFAAGYEAMTGAVQPSRVLAYGGLPDGLTALAPFIEYPTRWEGR